MMDKEDSTEDSTPVALVADFYNGLISKGCPAGRCH
jgi:hypothetical protein